MEEAVAGYVELLRGVLHAARVRTGTPATAEQLVALERALGVALPSEHKAVIGSLGYLCAGDTGELVIYGVAPPDHGCPAEVDLQRAAGAHVPLVRVAIAGEPTRVHVLDAQGQLRVLVVEENRLEEPTSASFAIVLQQAMQTAIEARMEAIADAAGARSDPDDDEPRPGEASVQLFAIPKPVVAALGKEPAVIDEITLYTSVAEFREQTVIWEKSVKHTESPTTKELVRRMRWLLTQRGIPQLKQLVTGLVEVPRWTDALITCFGDSAIEVLALRGAFDLPCEGTNTIRMIMPPEVRSVARALDGSDQRLRDGYAPAVLRARGLYNDDAPNEDAFLEELVALWDSVADGIREAAEAGCGWVIRRTDG